MSTDRTTLPEAALVAWLQRKDPAAFTYLYDNYSTALWGVAQRILNDEEAAQDALQDAFVKIWQYIDRYDPAKARLFTWLLNITRNAAIDKHRSLNTKSQPKIRSLDDSVRIVDRTHNISTPVEHIGIQSLLKKLPEEQRALLDLVYYQGYTQAEAAEELNIPLGTVKSRIRIAMKSLRELI